MASLRSSGQSPGRSATASTSHCSANKKGRAGVARPSLYGRSPIITRRCREPVRRDRLPAMTTLAINGFEMHCDVRGEGVPLLLLHGGLGIGEDWRLVF